MILVYIFVYNILAKSINFFIMFCLQVNQDERLFYLNEAALVGKGNDCTMLSVPYFNQGNQLFKPNNHFSIGGGGSGPCTCLNIDDFNVRNIC